eukprot:Selendium_serpulae@DN6330_c0_g1_i2.p1
MSIEVLMGVLELAAEGEAKQKLINGLTLDDEDPQSITKRLASVVGRKTQEGTYLTSQEKDADKSYPKIKFATQLWLNEDRVLTVAEQRALADYQKTIYGHYKAKAITADFQTNFEETKKEINEWVDKATEGLITDIAAAMPISTVAFFANAMYFHASWHHQFDQTETNEAGTFYTPVGAEGLVPMQAQMMSTYENPEFRHFPFTTLMKDDDMHVNAYELDYYGKEVSMVILMPTQVKTDPAKKTKLRVTPPTKNGLAELKGQLHDNEEFWPMIFHALDAKTSLKKIKLTMPKFSFEYKIPGLGKQLNKANMLDMFGDYPVIGNDGVLAHTAIQHKAFIKVDELGTEAAAVTDGTATDCYHPMVRHTIDMPFLFIIRHKESGSVLGMGQVTTPGVQVTKPKEVPEEWSESGGCSDEVLPARPQPHAAEDGKSTGSVVDDEWVTGGFPWKKTPKQGVAGREAFDEWSESGGSPTEAKFVVPTPRAQAYKRDNKWPVPDEILPPSPRFLARN